MDIAFKCPKCEQELEVDASGSGSEIQCPACGETLMIPEAPPQPEVTEMPPETPQQSMVELAAQQADAPSAGGSLNPISSSAAAKEEKHFAVPSRQGPAEVLIKKGSKPLEIAAQDSERKLRMKTIRHSDCYELGKDKFDDTVSDLLQRITEKHVVSVNPISYTHVDPTTQKILEDFGVLIVYHG
jgi:DNA-directed RNA polymerase subunit RPC12/RpoP